MFVMSNIAKGELSGFKIDSKKRKVTIPFKLVNNNILIPLTINNSDTLFFILDSGLKNTLITELFPEDNVVLNNTGERQIKGLGSGKNLTAIISSNNTIRLKGVIGKNQGVYIIKENIFNLSELAGQKINGIIGYNFFRDFVVKIDYYRKLLTIYAPKRYKKKLRSYTHFPLVIKKNKPYISTQIVSPKFKTQTLELMIDTGASLSLWLTSNDSIQIDKPAKLIPGFIGEGLSGRIYGDYGRIPALIFKNKKLKNILTAFPRPEYIQEVFAEKRSGSIGGGILHRFYVVFNYPKKTIALKKNHFFKDPFEYNLSGIEIYTPNPQIKLYGILSLRENSPAKVAGLKKDDIILKINNISTLRMGFSTVLENLNKRRRKGTTLLVQRDGKQVEIKYHIPKVSPI